jgi:transcription-repair coupling factor (superfamily II helicase)
VAGPSIRIGPVELPDSAQMRLKRLHPKANYKPAAKLVSIPKPTESGRVGGAPLRDVALLEWCTKLLTDLLTPVRV